MSSSITECPTCFTRFRVSADQLTARNGMVRCGRCSSIFNATEHLHDDESSPQLTQPVARTDNEASRLPDIKDLPNTDKFIMPPGVDNEFETLFQQIEYPDAAPAKKVDTPASKRPQWPWIASSLILLLLTLAQGVYFFRVELAARLPGLKPALISYCDLLKCTVPLPEKAELLSIESSDLVADPVQPNVVTLSALLHNRAEYAQALPNIELSLTDSQDKVLARRVFTPAEYLHSNDIEQNGVGANRELNIQLHLDSSELRPTGYKLLLFFPQNHR